MSSSLNALVAVCSAAFFLVLLVDLGLYHQVRRFLLELGSLAVAVVVLHLLTGFPRPSGLRSFGGPGPLPVVGLMFVAILLGMAARYAFYLRVPFSWTSFLKPFCASPIVLLPLLGTLQGVSSVEPIQLVSFGLLAFQSGFFWRVVFERAKP